MFDGLIASLGDGFSRVSSFLKETLLGKNNERLDFILDSFYKLSPQQRTGVMVASVALAVGTVVAIFGLYFSRVDALDQRLNQSSMAIGEFHIVEAKNKEAEAELSVLKDRILSKMKSFSIKPFFEKVAQEVSVEIKSTKVREADTVDIEDLSSFIKEQDVEIIISKISLPRLLKFISAVEKKQKYVRVKDLRVRDLSGKKLYFQAQIFFRAFKLS